jgi:hypothetical protein
VKQASSILCFGWVVLIAGFGGTSNAGGASGVSVQIQLVTFTHTPGADPTNPPSATQTFSLTCNPTGGTLPFADRICRDISLYPEAMLDPYRTHDHAVCGASTVPTDYVDVTATAEGKTISFSGGSFCSPNGVAGAVYRAAAESNEQWLASFEPRLRCDEEPVLHASRASVIGCMAGQWTPRTEHLIQIAEHASSLDTLRPAKLFPRDIGAQACTIPTGRPKGAHSLRGLCGVYLRDPWGTPTVSFSEDWRNGAKKERHVWHVTLNKNRVTAEAETGPTPPQLWR